MEVQPPKFHWEESQGLIRSGSMLRGEGRQPTSNVIPALIERLRGA